jgi:hypothetical protein
VEPRATVHASHGRVLRLSHIKRKGGGARLLRVWRVIVVLPRIALVRVERGCSRCQLLGGRASLTVILLSLELLLLS